MTLSRPFLLSLCLAALGCAGCSAALPAACDPVTVAAKAGACAARVQTECVAKGVPQAECTVLAECDALAEGHKKTCGGAK